MITAALDALASGLSLVYGRALGRDSALVFIVALGGAVLVAARPRPATSRSRPGLALPLTARSAPRLAVGVTWAIHLVPLAIAAPVLMRGDLVPGLVYLALGFAWIRAFLPLLPIWIVAVWYEHGWWQSLVANGAMFCLLRTPGWLVARARAGAHTADLPASTPAAAEESP